MLVVVLPGLLEQLQSGQHVSGPPHERLEQCELLGRQGDLGPVPPGQASGGVESQVADLDRRGPLALPTADQSPQPGQELGEGEGLGQVVVGAAVEAGDPVLDRSSSGQHQHRRPDAVLSHPPAGLEAVDPRQDHVEHDSVVGGGAGLREGLLAACCDIDRQILLGEATPDQRRHLHLILDHQDLHRHRGSQARLSADESRVSLPQPPP